MAIAAFPLLVRLALPIVGLTTASLAFAAEQRLTVVELFTSQGCSSCPSADTILGELAARPDVVAVSEHVDYWDYLGWRDPFASAVNTQRQRDYARLLSVRYVYTPQIVVQGTIQAAGNDKAAVVRAIQNAPALTVLVTLAWRDPGRLAISLGGGAARTPASVWVVTFDRLLTTPVSTGENGGRELRNYNVVRSLSLVGTWRGEPLDMVADVAAVHWNDGTCAVFLQADGTGPILGAARCGS